MLLVSATLMLSRPAFGFTPALLGRSGGTATYQRFVSQSSVSLAFGTKTRTFLSSSSLLLSAAAGDESATPAVEATDAPAEKPKEVTPPPPPPVDISKLDIRVGVITKAWEHEEADKLFCEEIDIGEEEPRQIASGLRAYYNIDDLPGQRVLVLANLKTRKMVGFPSHGMVMCASNDEEGKVEFVEPPADAAIGERVMVPGYDGEPATENQVLKKKMMNVIFPDLKTDDDGVATYKGEPFTTSAGPCKAQNGLANAEVA